MSAAFVYVAGSSNEIERVRVVREAVNATSSIVCVPNGDWTQFVEAERKGKLDKTAEECAWADVRAIDQSALVLAVWPRGLPSKGLCFEIGWACAKEKPVLIWDVENVVHSSGFIFASLPNVGVFTQPSWSTMLDFASWWARRSFRRGAQQ
jgi:nucleoside 2-deoxyribosyltransferase